MPHNQAKHRGTGGAGSIRKISSTKNGKTYTYWQGRYTEGYDPGTGKQIQRSVTGKTQKEVSQKLRQLTHELDEGRYVAPCHMTVGEWLELWKETYLGGVKPSTAYLYEREIQLHLLPHLGAIRLESLTAPHIQRCYNELLRPQKKGVRPLSPKSIKNVHGVLHRALQQAVLIGYLRFNPSDACVLPRITRKEIHPLEEDQIVAFLREIQGHPHEYLYRIALFTGLREGELLGLTWDCIDFDRGTLLVRQQLRREQKKGGEYYFSPPKNNRSRLLTLAPSVVQLLRWQRWKENELRVKAGELWEEHDLVFSNAYGGFLSHRTVYDCFKRVVAKIGTPTTRFHDLRHTYAVAAIKSGDDIKTVQENLGHATAAFTLDVYGHMTAQMRENSASRMEQFIRSVSGG